MNSDRSLDPQLLRAAFDSADAGLVVLDGDTNVQLWNAWMEERSGIASADAVGHALSKLFPEIVGGRLDRALREAAEHGRAAVVSLALGRSPLPLYRPGAPPVESQHIQHEIRVQPLPWVVEGQTDERPPAAALMHVVDRTSTAKRERLLLDSAMRTAALADELVKKNAELDRFASIVAHDLQEPVRTMRGMAGMLSRTLAGDLPEAARTQLDFIEEAGARMHSMIVSLLDLSRVTTRGRSFEEVDLAPLVDGVKRDLHGLLAQTEGRLEVGSLPRVPGDPVQLEALFLNLAANGLKFHREGVPPIVSIEGGRCEEGFEIRVSDNGIGIGEEHLEAIFDVFRRLHRRDAFEGTGIGLTTCRKIVERHRGAIRVSSVEGEGSCFAVILPEALPES